MNIFILVILLTTPNGDVNEYVIEGGVSWYECEVLGSIHESFNPDINWYCDHETIGN